MTAIRYENVWTVYINGVPQEYPVIDVTRSVGARSVQSAKFRYKPSEPISKELWHEGRELRNIFTNDTHVEIKRGRRNEDEITVHIGYVVGGKLSVDPNEGEVIIINSRFDDYLMTAGKTVGTLHWGDITTLDHPGEVTMRYPTDLDFIVNPVVNGYAFKNRYRYKDEDDEDAKTIILPIDPESLPDDWEDNIEFKKVIDYWSPAELIYYLLTELNKDEVYVENPKLEDLEAQMGKDRNMLRHFLVERGQFLPKIFDALTIPYGYSWMYTYSGTGNKPKLYFWLRNNPHTRANVWLAPSGEVINTDPTDGVAPFSEVDRFSINYDITNRAANWIEAVGDFKEYEFTEELVPAWDPDLEWHPSKDLIEGSDEMSTEPGLRRVYRDWVLNEAGDYRDFADHDNRKNGFYDDGLRFAYDFKPIFGDENYVMRRRHLEKTITIHDDKIGGPAGIYNGVRVDIYAKKLDGTWDWTTPAKLGLSVQILKNEIGVRLGSTKEGPDIVRSMFHPLEVVDTFRVQITGTVKSDMRVRPKTITKYKSLIIQPKVLEINAGRKYAFRQVDPSSWYSGSGAYKTREHDATAELEALSTQLSSSWNVSTVGGTISLEGTDSNSEYLGWDIVGFQTRNFTLRATATDDAGVEFHELYPNVVAVKYDPQHEKTILTLDVFRQDLRTV